MNISDIKGEKAFDILADAMELADKLGDDKSFKSLLSDLKKLNGKDDKAGLWRVFCKRIPPILRNDDYKARTMAILAAIADVPYEEYAKSGSVVSDVFDLFLSDSEAIDFLSTSAATQE